MGRRGPEPDHAKREAFARLISEGVPSVRAARTVGINPRTGKRWRNGRTIRSGGRVVELPPVFTSFALTEKRYSARYLSEDERVRLADLRREKRTVREIAALIGRSPSTISRELTRGVDEVPAFVISGMRIDGVPAHDYTERVMEMSLTSQASYEALMPLLRFEWGDVGGRDVYTGTLAPPETLVQVAIEMAEERGAELTEQELAGIRAFQLPHPDMGVHLYPRGEVLYFISLNVDADAEDLPTLAEILAELP